MHCVYLSVQFYYRTVLFSWISVSFKSVANYFAERARASMLSSIQKMTLLISRNNDSCNLTLVRKFTGYIAEWQYVWNETDWTRIIHIIIAHCARHTHTLILTSKPKHPQILNSIDENMHDRKFAV